MAADQGRADGASVPRVANGFRLSVADEQGRVRLCKPLEDGERFILRHRHSVHRSLVTEYLGPGPGDTIIILEGRYADYGAGLPQKAEQGQTLEFDGGSARLFPAPAPRPKIEVRVGREAEHTIIHRGSHYTLSDLISPGSTAIFTISEGVCAHELP